MSVQNPDGVCINIADECKAEARQRLRDYLDGVDVHETPFDDAKEVLDDWLAETRADLGAEIARLQTVVTAARACERHERNGIALGDVGWAYRREELRGACNAAVHVLDATTKSEEGGR